MMICTAKKAWATIKTFNAKYCEFITPTNGTGEGVQRYGWTASQYIQAIIENLFGIDYDLHEKRLRIIPQIPKELMGKKIEISNLKIPSHNDLRLNLKIMQKEKGKAIVSVNFTGELPSDEIVEIGLPTHEGKPYTVKDKNGEKHHPVKVIDELTNISGICLKMENNIELIFE